MEALINVIQASQLTSLSESTLRHYSCQRLIPHYKVGKRLMFDKDELISWQHQFRVKTAQELNQEAINYCTTH